MKLNIEQDFNKENVLKVVNILEDYLPILFAQEPNIELAYCDTIQRNWLAYYIGFKKGYIKGKNSDSSID